MSFCSLIVIQISQCVHCVIITHCKRLNA